MAADGHDPLLAKILGDLRKAKAGIYTNFADGVKVSEPHFRLSTGVTLLDYAIGGGLPVGRVVEIHGKEATGKSLIGLNLIGEAVKLGWIAAYLETERAPTVDFATRLGHVDPDSFIYINPPLDKGGEPQPWTLEAAMDAISEFIETTRVTSPVSDGIPIVIVWDSYAGLCCKSELLLRMDQRDAMGKRAYTLRTWFTKEVQTFSNQEVLLIVMNHVTANIGNPFEPETTPGGSAIRMFTSVRLKFRNGEIIKNEETKDPKGVWVQWRIIKNRMDQPGRTSRFPIYYADGIHDHEALFDFLWERGHLGSSRGWVTWGDKKYRKDDFLAKVAADPNVRSVLATHAKQVWDDKAGDEPEVGVEEGFTTDGSET